MPGFLTFHTYELRKTNCNKMDSQKMGRTIAKYFRRSFAFLLIHFLITPRWISWQITIFDIIFQLWDSCLSTDEEILHHFCFKNAVFRHEKSDATFLWITNMKFSFRCRNVLALRRVWCQIVDDETPCPVFIDFLIIVLQINYYTTIYVKNVCKEFFVFRHTQNYFTVFYESAYISSI